LEAFLQITFGGLIFGSIYALAAIGIVLIYKTTDVVNFAHGEMAMATTFISFTLFKMVGLPFFVSFILALVFAAIFGMTVYQTFMKRVQKAPPLNQIVVTLGLFLVINGIAGLIWGYKPFGYPNAIKGDSFQLGSIFMKPHELFILGITLVLMIVFYIIFKYFKIGLAMRATQQDMQTSSLMGIKVSQVFNWTWATGAILGGVAGILTAPVTYLEPSMMLDILIMGFAAAVFGGFVNLPGAVIGGIIVGIYSNWVSYYIGSELSVAFVFLLIVVVLYVKPTGLFGVKYVKKV
jgi:branched-chain amino acid transport system permease protein